MDVKQQLAEAQKEWKSLVEQREALDRKMNALAQVIDGFKSMLQDSEVVGAPIEPPPTLESVEREIGGLTNLIRGFFDLATHPVFPTEIRDALQNAPIYKSGMRPLPTNLLTTVHSILSRLLQNDEIEAVDRDGKTAYRRIGGLRRAVKQFEKQQKADAIRRDRVRRAVGAIAPPPKLSDLM